MINGKFECFGVKIRFYGDVSHESVLCENESLSYMDPMLCLQLDVVLSVKGISYMTMK